MTHKRLNEARRARRVGVSSDITQNSAKTQHMSCQSDSETVHIEYRQIIIIFQ